MEPSKPTPRPADAEGEASMGSTSESPVATSASREPRQPRARRERPVREATAERPAPRQEAARDVREEPRPEPSRQESRGESHREPRREARQELRRGPPPATCSRGDDDDHRVVGFGSDVPAFLARK